MLGVCLIKVYNTFRKGKKYGKLFGVIINNIKFNNLDSILYYIL